MPDKIDAPPPKWPDFSPYKPADWSIDIVGATPLGRFVCVGWGKPSKAIAPNAPDPAL